MAGMASPGEVSSGFVGSGVVRLGRYGEVRSVTFRFVGVWFGAVWCRMAGVETPERRM